MTKVRLSCVSGSVLALVLLIALNLSIFSRKEKTKMISLQDLREATSSAASSMSSKTRLKSNGTERLVEEEQDPTNTRTTTTQHRNVINKATKVLSSSGGNTAVLVDSKTHGYYKDKATSVCTDLEKDPWFEVDLGGAFTVRHVEVWAPKKSCESIKFKGRCERTQDVMVVTKASPMRLELVLSSNSEVKGNFTSISNPRTIYAWDDLEDQASKVRISLSGPKQRLCATEIKVFVADDDFQLCTAKTCKFGQCKCLDEGCKRKKCACGSSSIGEHDCGTNPSSDWRYFPIEKTATDGKSWNWDSDLVNRTTARLQQLQNPKACSRSSDVHGLIGAQGRGAGLASTLHFMSGHLSEAYRTKRPFVFGGRMNYAGTKYCRERDMYGDPDCYLEPVAGGSCLKRKAQLRKSYKPISGPSRHPNRCAIGKLCNDVGHFRYLPKDFEDAGMGLLHFRSAVVSHLVKLNNSTRELLGLEELKAKIGFEHPIIGVHIRHGDACHTTDRKGRCKGLSFYVPEIRTLAARYKTNRVFIATDDESILKSTKSYSKEFKFVFADSFSRDLFDSKDQIEYRKDLWTGNNNKGHSIMVSSLIDLMLLAECDYLVLHLLSNLSRLALELAAARKEAIPPYFSMDGPWCHHWKMCTS